MAITLVKEPAQFQNLSDNNEWKLQLTSGGTSTTKIEMRYQVLTVQNDPISAIEPVPYTGHEHRIDVRNELERRMVTLPIPSGIDNPIAQLGQQAPDLGFYLDYKISYWELTTDLTDCSTTQGTVTTSQVKRLRNNYVTVFDKVYDRIYTNRPYKNEIFKYQDDWILFSDPSYDWNVKVYTTENGGTEQLQHTGNYGAGTWIIGCGGANLLSQPDLTNVCEYRVELLNGVTSIQSFVFILKKCERKSFNEVIWREPKGGWASIAFEDNSISTAGGQNTVFNKPKPIDLDNSAINFYDTGIISDYDNLQLRVQLSKSFSYSNEYVDFLRGLFASNNVYINYYRGDSTSKTWARCNIENRENAIKQLEDGFINLQVTLTNPVTAHRAY